MKGVTAIFFSPNKTTENWTKAVGEGLAEVWGTELKSCDITRCFRDHMEGGQYGPEDLLVIGVPVYINYIPSAACAYLKTMKGNKTPCVLVASYGNRGHGRCLAQMRRILSEQGFLPIGAAAFSSQHCMIPQINTGHPDEEDKERARRYGSQIAAQMKNGNMKNMILEAEDLPYPNTMNTEEEMMEFPQRQKKTSVGALPKGGPKAGDQCDHCGICGEVCPTGAIGGDGNMVFPERCLKCCACVAACPRKVLDFVEPEFQTLRKRGLEKFASPIYEDAYFSHKR